MKILVIGGAGFIGSHLCESYAIRHEVTSIDNYISGSKDNHIDGVQYIEMDAINIKSLDKSYDLVFHLGEYSRVEKSLEKIDFVFENNLNPMINILQFCKQCNAKLIYAGSSTKFGDMGENKYKSPYAFSKWKNSELVRFYCEFNKMNYAITYFYNVYGGRENPEGEFATVIAKFLKRAFNNQQLEVTLPGTQKRNFTHIEDTIEALILIAEHGNGDEYGIGSDESYSIIDVAKLISNDIVFTPENIANRITSEVISEKTKNLGWSEKYNLKKYIESQL